MPATKDAFKNHLCGSYYDKKGRCEHLLPVSEEGKTYGKKILKLYYCYCTAEGKCRSLGSIATFTGNSPTWCPKRKALSEQNR